MHAHTHSHVYTHIHTQLPVGDAEGAPVVNVGAIVKGVLVTGALVFWVGALDGTEVGERLPLILGANEIGLRVITVGFLVGELVKA
jgi:hypothetical protein